MVIKVQDLHMSANNCPFCNNPKLESRIIYKDTLVFGFPTNIPITPGHVLICPVRHVAKIDELSEQELVAITNLIIKMKNSLTKAVGAQGFNIAFNEGECAGQSISHLHVHVVPRQPGDQGVYGYEPRKFLYRSGSRSESPDAELQQIGELIKNNL